jgi:nucleoside-diphosphate-sugar epimerase
MKHILILGSEGFIGNHLVNYFLDKGFTVYGCDLLKPHAIMGINMLRYQDYRRNGMIYFRNNPMIFVSTLQVPVTYLIL